jgi:hypothetical protein
VVAALQVNSLDLPSKPALFFLASTRGRPVYHLSVEYIHTFTFIFARFPLV